MMSRIFGPNIYDVTGGGQREWGAMQFFLLTKCVGELDWQDK
jgi:hypothetical protein